MSLLEELKTLKVDVEEGTERLMGNAALYERMLKKFSDMIKKSVISPDFDNNNYNEITEKAHALKGACGNLSITPLYKGYTEIVNLLRANEPEQAKARLKELLPVQEEIIKCIEKYI